MLTINHVCSTSGYLINVLKTFGKHIKLNLQASAKILEMAHHCTQVTHLIINDDIDFSLNDLEEAIHMMAHLQ